MISFFCKELTRSLTYSDHGECSNINTSVIIPNNHLIPH